MSLHSFQTLLVVALVASVASMSFVNILDSNVELNKVENPKVDDNNIILCDIDDPEQDNWRRLDAETVSAKGKFLQIVQKTITYPRAGVGDYELVCIRVLDLIADGSGGYPNILDGGLEFHHVTIQFKSQRSYGFKFSVEIFGKKPGEDSEDTTQRNAIVKH